MAWSLIRHSDSLRKQGVCYQTLEFLIGVGKLGDFLLFTPEGEHVPHALKNTSHCEAYLEANSVIVIHHQK